MKWRERRERGAYLPPKRESEREEGVSERGERGREGWAMGDDLFTTLMA